MRRTPATTILLLLALVLAACGGGASAAAGTYRLDAAALAASFAEGMAGIDEAQKKMILDGMTKQMEGSIELKADGTASMRMKMSMMGTDKSEEDAGTWTLSGTTVSITSKGKDGKAETKSGTLANGALTFEQDFDGKKVKMVWRR